MRARAQGIGIYNGIYSGRISFPESQKLVAGSGHVQNLETSQADASSTPLERARIHARKNPERRIFLKKHN